MEFQRKPDVHRQFIKQLQLFRVKEIRCVSIQIKDADDASFDLPAGDEGAGAGDTLYAQAVAVVCREGKASTSFVQRHLQIGYNRAARIIERMEAEGIVSTANHVGKREVLARGGD